MSVDERALRAAIRKRMGQQMDPAAIEAECFHLHPGLTPELYAAALVHIAKEAIDLLGHQGRPGGDT